MTNRQIKESPLTQGENESIPYTLTTTPWGSAPTNVNVTVWDVTGADSTDDWEDVTETVMPTNDPTVDDDVITLSPLESLTDGHIYRIEIQFTCDNGTFETYCFIFGGE
jgi:hypothetical protein